MDLLKFALDRLFGFLAVLIPGSAVLLLFILHRPSLIALLWEATILSYETKLAISLLFTFAMGWTVNSCVNGVLGALGGVIGGRLNTNDPETKPWHNQAWRALLANYLGDVAPADVDPMSESAFQTELELIKHYPAEQRVARTLSVIKGKIDADANDFQWRTWWNHFHHMSFLKLEPVAAMTGSLTTNFQAASMVLLFAMPFTPTLRTWWLIAFCLFWIVVLVVQSVVIVINARDPWSSFTNQLEDLRPDIGRKTPVSKYME